jgi:hypothetical protein
MAGSRKVAILLGFCAAAVFSPRRLPATFKRHQAGRAEISMKWLEYTDI